MKVWESYIQAVINRQLKVKEWSIQKLKLNSKKKKEDEFRTDILEDYS